ncbi:MAG TPA: hypothetical protein VLA88_04595 [Candidatus Saccharimonadales bacterium]|nr:hypothetical protein [Candidatus Saccharimonadales bacterium]
MYVSPESKGHIEATRQLPPQPERELAPATRAAYFYRELATPDMLPAPIESDDEPVIATITDAVTFEINGAPVMLRGHQLFIWNSLLFLRHNEDGISRSDVIALGFAEDANVEVTKTNLWKINVKYLMDKVNSAAGMNIITRSGRTKQVRYHVHPNLEVQLAEQPEQRPEGWYEYAQKINGPLMRLEEPVFISAEGDDAEPLEIIIRDDDTIVVHNVAHIISHNRRALLHLLMLNNGSEMTHEAMFHLGFHPYANHEEAARRAISLTVNVLNRIAGDTEENPFLSQHFGIIDSSTVMLERNLKIVDTRLPANVSIPALNTVREEFERMKATINTQTMADTVHRLFSERDLSGIPLQDLYFASLRYGVVLDELRGTSTVIDDLYEVSYDTLLAIMHPGKLNPKITLKEVFHVHRRYGALESRALAALRDAPLRETVTPDDGAAETEEGALGPERFTDTPLHHLIRQAEAEDPATRIQRWLSGTYAHTILKVFGRSAAEAQAVANHFSPTGKPHQMLLRTALPYVRRYITAIAELFADDAISEDDESVASYRQALYYLGKMAGNPAREKPIMTYTTLRATDPAFGADPYLYSANAWALLATFAKTHPLPRRP